MAIDKLPYTGNLNTFHNGVGIFPSYTIISDMKPDMVQYFIALDKSHWDLINWKLYLMNDGKPNKQCIDLGGNIGKDSNTNNTNNLILILIQI